MRIIVLLLVAVLFSNSVNAAAQSTAKKSGVVAGFVGAMTIIGIGTYFAVQSAHTIKGCVSDDPNGLLLHTGNGKAYLLLGATTKIKADTKIKVTGTRKKKIEGLTDQPTFVVEKLGKVYGSCSVSPAGP